MIIFAFARQCKNRGFEGANAVIMRHCITRAARAKITKLTDMWGMIRHWLSQDMAIDLGTANTIIYLQNQGIVLNEPSVIAIETDGGSKRIREVGQAAKQMLGRTPGNIQAIRPLRDGNIADYRLTAQMLNHFIKKAHGAHFLTPGPRIVICVPYSSTPVDRRAIRESAQEAGATKVFLIEEPMAAAIGSGLPVNEGSGSMIVDIGGGTTEIGIISFGGVVYGASRKVGGDHFDTAIVNHVRSEYGISIGESQAERIKKQIAAASEEEASRDNREVRVSGAHIAEGVPRSFAMSGSQMLSAIQRPLSEILDAVREALRNTPPELAGDIAEHGMVLTGGGALIAGLDVLIAYHTGVPVRVAEDPLTCVVRGCGAALEYIDKNNIGIFD